MTSLQAAHVTSAAASLTLAIAAVMHIRLCPIYQQLHRLYLWIWITGALVMCGAEIVLAIGAWR